MPERLQTVLIDTEFSRSPFAIAFMRGYSLVNPRKETAARAARSQEAPHQTIFGASV